jgi:N-acetylglucosamine-6-phosphate deacetylase
LRANWFDGKQWLIVDADFEGATVSAVGEGRDESTPTLVPGLVDIHCHGAEGHDVNEGGAVEAIAALRKRGVEWVCPTTVAAPLDRLREIVEEIPPETPGFAGFHLEGPFLSPSYPGAQPEMYLRMPSVQEFDHALGGVLPKIRIVTLAPELPGAEELIRFLFRRGIIVSAGHTDADKEVMQSAASAGLRHITHLFNAMRPFHHRDPGIVGFGLTSTIVCELIYDRVHVSRLAASLVFIAKRLADVIAVSDGTALSGMPSGTVRQLWGHEVRVEARSARLADGRLCGSVATMPEVFQALWQDFPEFPERAVAACSLNPRRALGLPPAEMWLLVGREGAIEEVVAGNLRPPTD